MKEVGNPVELNSLDSYLNYRLGELEIWPIFAAQKSEREKSREQRENKRLAIGELATAVRYRHLEEKKNLTARWVAVPMGLTAVLFASE